MDDARPTGLRSEEVEARRAVHGLNEVAVGRRRSAWIDLLSRFASPLVLVLLVASGVAGVLGDPESFAIICAVVVLSVVLDFAEERRARNAATELRRKVGTR